MMPVTDNSTIYSYIPETTSGKGVLKGYDTQAESGSKKGIDIASLGKNDFMKLLLAQMQHQDPLNPTDNTQFVAQLAQFSSLEQVTQMNLNLEKNLENNTLIAEAVNNAMMINYFGKSVSAESDAFVFDGENPVELNFSLDTAISSGKLEILNKNGVVVHTITLGEMDGGLNAVEWDGITNLSLKAAEGEYSYRIDAYDILNNSVETTRIFSGIVDGISYREGKAYLSVDGVLVPFDSVEQISEVE